MYDFLVHLHSIGRWLVLLFLLIGIFRSLTAGRRAYNRADARNGLILTIVTDLMLLVGIVLWFIGPWGYQQIQGNGMGEVMRIPASRFYVMEHTVGMLIAVILIHIGKSQGKKAIPDAAKHRRTLIFYAIALLLILVSIPWPFREIGSMRGWY